MPNLPITEYGHQGCLFVESDDNTFNLLPNGTIEAFVDTNSGTNAPPVWFPVPVSSMCCALIGTNGYADTHPDLSGHTYTWDADRQECRWIEYVDCDDLPPFSVVLNPDGNEGALFEVQPEETCVLEVSFEYMFKFDCQDMYEVQVNNNSVADDLRNLYNTLDLYIGDCLTNQDSLDNIQGGFNYVLASDPDQTQVYTYYCVSTAGLVLFEALVDQFMGAGAWDDYLSGDIHPTDIAANFPQVVEEMILANDANQELYLTLCENGGDLIDDTYVYLGLYDTYTTALETCNTGIAVTQDAINLLLAQNSEGCIYAIDTMEELIVNMAIDVQNPTNPNLVDTIYTEEIYNVGEGNLVNYLIKNSRNPIYIENYNWRTCDTSICNLLAVILTQQMLDQGNEDELFSGDTYYSQYNQLQSMVGVDAFGTNWQTFTTTITDQAIISGMTGELINLSLQVADSCVNFSILIDKIEMNKVCERVTNTETFISQNPSFDIKKVCDNKKSWVVNTTPEERLYSLPLRETDYDVNDSRLVLNTKEVDLNLSISNGIETDVWCYTNDNPCILEPCVSASTTIITSGTCIGSLTGVTNWTGGTTPLPTSVQSSDPNFPFNLAAIQDAGDGTIPTSAFTTEFSGCSFAHKIDRYWADPTQFQGAWIVGNYDGEVDYYVNVTIENGSDITQYRPSTLSQTNCNDVGAAITAYNAFSGSNFQTIYWDGVGCVFDQVLTGATTATTITDDCCCDIPPLSGTNITGGTVALPEDADEYSGCPWTIGGAGPAGGIVYWIDPSNPCAGYEVMSADTAPLVQVWCTNPGWIGTSAAFGSGEANTANIYNLTSPTSEAGSTCYNSSEGGFNDWFLPSIGDLEVIAANTNEFDGLANESSYWSSTESTDSAGNYSMAWAWNGLLGSTTFKKNSDRRVRGARYFDTSPCPIIYSGLTAATVYNGIGEEYPDCDSWIYKFNNTPPPSPFFQGWWIAGMPDSTVGLFQQETLSGGTATTIDYSRVISETCCNSFNELIQDYAWASAKGEYYTEFRWDVNCEQCKFVKCAKPHCMDFTELLTSPVSGLTTIKQFNEIISSELINARCRKISSSYPTLRALYERYMNSTEYCDTQSAQFDYDSMMDFSSLVGNYWVDLIEQVIPSTTIWGANNIYGNTLYDQQKFKYRGHSLFPCNFWGDPMEFALERTASGATDVDLYTISSDSVCIAKETCENVYYVTGDCGSEFLGKITDTISP